ncbi:MAG TPA: amidohydrolase [Marmoricola sp.]|nr:amidohydrolase [Marmoricola sp.]
MPDLSTAVRAAVADLADELTAFRRDLHAHPELSWAETRTTGLVAARLEQAGARVELLPTSGLVADIGPADGPRVALRADLDALTVDDRTDDPWRSTVPGVAHACGHDVHTTALLGAGLALASYADRLDRGVRLLFQPAEEVMPGGALALVSAGALAEVAEIFMLHCDPSLDVGEVGLRVGALTAAADALEVRLTGRGGHTSRPHLTEDLTFALGKLVTELPAVLSRRLDPRAGVSLVWGLVQAGSAMNVIPSTGRAAGTVRMLDAQAWAGAEKLVRSVTDELMAPYGVLVEVSYSQGVPPVVNTPEAAERLAAGVVATLGPAGLVPTAQSLGGEDFAWYLEHVPGAMARLGTRTPGGPAYDLHRGDLRIDERAVVIGAQVLASTAVGAGT